jgi:hypothetical protein
MYNEVKALVNCLSEDTDDYPDQAYYRMVMEKLGAVKDELEIIETSRRGWKTKQELPTNRENKAEQEWQNADLTSHIESDDIHIESDGWESDGEFYSRRYYISVDGKESIMRHFLVSFVKDSDKVADTDNT